MIVFNIETMKIANIKTFNGDFFQIKYNKFYDLLEKIEEYNNDYNKIFVRLFYDYKGEYDDNNDNEIKYDELKDEEDIFLFMTTDINIKIEKYCHNEDKYGLDIFFIPSIDKLDKYKIELLYIPSKKQFIDENDDEYTCLRSLLEDKLIFPKIQKENAISTISNELEKWMEHLSYIINFFDEDF